MSEQDAQGEPTMEEILASIRRIISEDDEDAGADVAAEASEETGADPEPVIEAVPEPESEPEPEPEPEAEPEPETASEPEPEPEPEPEAAAAEPEVPDDDVLELTEEMEEPAAEDESDVTATDPGAEDDAPEVEAEEAAPAEPAEDSMPEPDVLVSKVTEESSQEAFDRLSALMVAGYDGAGNTLEGLVRELLKPMLQAYLDENLPEIVRDLVEREVARIARKQ